MESTDVLITRVLAGELDLYAELVRRHQSEVWRAAGFLLRDPRTTEDLVQQAFVNAFRHLDRFRLGSDFGVWIKAIARNLAKQELRTRSREDRRMEVYQELVENRHVEERETAVGEALRVCREKLPERGAEALAMRYERALDFEEIARTLGATVNATRQLLSRVRIALRDCIEEARPDMTRAEELVLKSLDEGLSTAEAAELEALGKDPRLDLLRDVEGALRGARPMPDFGRAVVEEIRRGQTDRVMEAVKAESPAWNRRASAWPRVAAAAALFLAALLAGLLKDEPLARVVEGDPDAFFVRGEESLKAVAGLVVRPGDSLVTCSRDITLRYEGESTLVRIVPLSEIVFQGERRAKRIELREGEIEAEVAPQKSPLVITAAHARAEVLGTKLRLSATRDATRLEVAEGQVRFTRKADGAALLVSANQYTVAVPDEEFVACEMAAAAEVAPWISGFSLIRLDFPREEVPGFEDLRDGAVISLSKMPVRRLNIRANTEPDRVGSVRFAYLGRETYNTEMIWPYTLVPNDGCVGPPWEPKPGLHTVTATPFTGSYGNGLRGEPKTITFTIVD